MAATTVPTKRALIDKSNSTIVAITAVAAFVIVFCLMASKALISQELYQGRVISQKKVALNQLKADITDSKQLVSSYASFVNTPTNILNGSTTGTGTSDGDNGKIILDALPSEYDFPALATSLASMVSAQGLTTSGISGTDQELIQQSTQPSGSPQPVAMPFDLSVQGSYLQIEALISSFQRSIRPIQILTVNLSGSQSDIRAEISAQTYYQPEKTLNISEETVK